MATFITRPAGETHHLAYRRLLPIFGKPLLGGAPFATDNAPTQGRDQKATFIVNPGRFVYNATP